MCFGQPGDEMLSNRRRHTRVPVRAQVTCVVDGQTMRGVSRNLSQGGILVEVGDLKTKDAVQLAFRLPVSGVVVDAVGSVVWGSQRRRGIRFTSMGEQSQQTIRQFIAEQTERQS
jgi:hypothetical protein